MLRSVGLVTLLCLLPTVISECNFNRSVLENALRGKVLRAHYINSKPQAFIDPDTGKLTGALVEIYNEIMNQAGFTVSIQPISATSLASHNSSWTACVADVGLGILDICIGDLWETPERRALSTFATPFRTDTFLLSLVPPTAPEIDYMGGVFKPFTPQLWATLAACVIIVGWWHALLEGNWWDKKRRNKPKKKPDGTPKPLQPQHVRATKKTAHQIYMTAVGFFGAAMETDATKTVAGRIVTVAFGLLVLIANSSYTANLASMLTTGKVSLPFNNMEEAVASGSTLCINGVILSTLKDLYKGINVQSLGSWSKIYGNLSASDDDPWRNKPCTGAVTTLHSLNVEHSRVDPEQGIQGAHCDVQFVGQPFLTVMNAQAVAPDYVPTISYYMSKLRASPFIEKTWAKYFISQCSSEAEEPTDVLGVINLAGAFIILAAAMLFSIPTFLLECYMRFRRRKLKAARGQKGDDECITEAQMLYRLDVKVDALEELIRCLSNTTHEAAWQKTRPEAGHGSGDHSLAWVGEHGHAHSAKGNGSEDGQPNGGYANGQGGYANGQQGGYANGQGGYANGQGGYANGQGGYANGQGGYANDVDGAGDLLRPGQNGATGIVVEPFVSTLPRDSPVDGEEMTSRLMMSHDDGTGPLRRHPNTEQFQDDASFTDSYSRNPPMARYDDTGNLIAPRTNQDWWERQLSKGMSIC